MSTSKTRTQPHYNWLYWQHYRWHEHTAADCERAVLVRGLCWQRHFTAQRQVEADETGCCSARGARAQPRRSNSRRRRSNSRRRAHLGRVRGRAGRRRLVNGGTASEYLRRRGSREWASGARLQVPGRAAAGAGERCTHQGADDARAAAGTHARGCCAGVHGANTVRRRGARVRRPLVGAGPPGSSWCPS